MRDAGFCSECGRRYDRATLLQQYWDSGWFNAWKRTRRGRVASFLFRCFVVTLCFALLVMLVPLAVKQTLGPDSAAVVHLSQRYEQFQWWIVAIVGSMIVSGWGYAALYATEAFRVRRQRKGGEPPGA